ncbi:MAG: alpha/beta hydrolase [Thermodesulfobacteriota bacterium]|nr:alpha/beta hydrolase [Thermodesulfobacteriota bacterium]
MADPNQVNTVNPYFEMILPAVGIKKNLYLLILICSAAIIFIFTGKALFPELKDYEDSYIILLHGLGRTSISMKRLEWVLSDKGYDVINAGYPSTKFSIRHLANDHLDRIIKEHCAEPDRKIHFMTHSMGGIILRCYLQKHKLANIGRVIMFGPPNQGSEIADHFKNNFLYKFFMGPAGQEIGTGLNDIPCKLGPVDFELGVIAGNSTLNPYFSYIIPGPDDGKVSVKRAKISGMKDFLVVHTSHSFMIWRKKVIKQAIYFLENGMFYRQ